MSVQRLIDAGELPDDPLGAAGAFYAEILPAARAALADGADVVLQFAAADYRHDGWRLAMVQQLAREAAPLRVNAVVGASDAAMLEYLAHAHAVTGQVLQVDGNFAESA